VTIASPPSPSPGSGTVAVSAPASPLSSWTRKHLLGLEDLSSEEIMAILETAQSFAEISTRSRKKVPAMQGRIVFNLFFENSTRTRTSFSLAAKRLSADTQDFSVSASSLSKGETFIDTAKNIEAMGADVMVVRHPTPGAPHLLARHVKASIINAGDGAHEHPTQGLLDLMTIRKAKGRIEGLTVGLLGDIVHSRVARSNIWGLTKLGANVILCGPPTLVPRSMERLGCEVANRLEDILPRCDVVNVLRIQFERQQGGLFPSVGEYSHSYMMTQDRVRMAKPDLLLLAPGPINRGIEMTSEVADGKHSAILDQVTNGLAVRMAVLYLLSGKMDSRTTQAD
jgi:aspartate carbamoyltransferase catalytic subunit